jgi:hypothetical protein
MLWPPASASLGQVTIVWMFGIAMAYHFRKSSQFWSGASLGLASLSKYMPGLLVFIYIVKRRWRGVLGFFSVWIFSLALVSILNSAAIPRYFEENRTTTFAILERADNGAPLLMVYRYAGLAGIVSVAIFFALILFTNRRYFHEWKTYPPTRAWMILAYLAVACLPIFWVYSLMPLLPVLIFLLIQRKIITTIIGLYCLLIPSIFLHGDERSLIFIASVSLLTGLAFILDVLPFKVFQRQWGAGLSTLAEMERKAAPRQT